MNFLSGSDILFSSLGGFLLDARFIYSLTGLLGSIDFARCNMPVHWRSNKQPITSYSSATAEIYAFSEAVKDTQSLLWRAEDLGVRVTWPCKIKEDNAATVSFQKATVVDTKMKGVYNLRWNWVKELRDAEKVEAVKVSTDANVADLLTKCQEAYQMRRLLKVIGYDVEPAFDDKPHF